MICVDCIYAFFMIVENQNVVQLPSNQPVMGSVVDILSPKFSDNSSEQVHDLLCKISPK